MNDIFLSNNSEIKFLDKIKENLLNCISFSFSVSFVKKAGLLLLEKEIEAALKRGCIGRFILSTYQNFTDIPSLKTLLEWQNKYDNFKVHLDYDCFVDQGFHTKGYIFEYKNSYELIIGSSNFTRYALLKNIEWNISLYDKNEFCSFKKLIEEFENIWENTFNLNEKLINNYSLQLEYAIDRWDMDKYNFISNEIKPNSMQKNALKEIKRYRDIGVNRALVISATGSGKTYLAAFDALNFAAKRLLYIVHKDLILNEAKNTFYKVFGGRKTCGLFTGERRDLDCDFIFATNIMVSKNLDLFLKDEFDYIVIDEAHHATSKTIRDILNYFNPVFVLGLTATPERMDNKDVFELFDKNVPYELRLKDAINNNLIVPFHYYGIRDSLIDYGSLDISKIVKEINNKLNIDFIIEELNKHLPKTKLKCIAFCTNILHARSLSEEFIKRGITSTYLTGKNDYSERKAAFESLEDENNSLTIICCVDILNEGIDLPGINTVLFLRPTESSTIFIQQLGRGLRKYKNKDYLTVLDFIGNNYERSAQIAFALGSLGNSTYLEKSYLKELILNDFIPLNIPGVEIYIDSLSKEEIIRGLDNINFYKKDILKKDYLNFKKYIGNLNIPKHMDYLDNENAPDLMRFLKSNINNKVCSYYNFLLAIQEEDGLDFNKEESEIIKNISNLLPLCRVDEFAILKSIINNESFDFDDLKIKYSNINKRSFDNALYFLKKDNILDSNNALVIRPLNKTLNEYLLDLLDYGLTKYNIDFGDFKGEFKLYNNYYKEQILKILGERTTMFVKGTKFLDDQTTICFVGLKKDKEKLERTNYKDKFIDSKVFQWESENNTTFENSTGKKLLNTKKVILFVRKMDSENGVVLPFTYFGTGTFKNVRESYVEQIDKENNITKSNTLLFDIELDKEVEKDFWFDFEIQETEYFN